MKQLIVALAVVATVLMFGVIEAQQPRGDLYGSRALQSLEQALSASGTLRFPNYAADPFACAAATYGSYYYNTVANESRICDNAGWTAVGGGAGLTVGTAATIPMWNAVPDDLVDSALTDDGTNVISTEAFHAPAGAVGLPAYSFTASPTTGLYDGAGIIRFSVTGVQRAYLNTAEFAGVVPFAAPDGAAATPGYRFTGDNNLGLYRIANDTLGHTAGGEQLTAWTNLDTAGTGGDIWTFTEDLPIFDGSDTARGMVIDITNANHTGASNFIHGLTVAIDSNDADSVEIGAIFDGDWTRDLYFLNTGAAGVSFRIETATANTTYSYNFEAGSASYRRVVNQSFFRIPAPVSGQNQDGSDEYNLFSVGGSIHNGGGTGNILNMINVYDTLDDAQVFESGIRIKNELDAHLLLEVNTAAMDEDPPTGFVAILLDDNADYSGGGGNDCAIVACTPVGSAAACVAGTPVALGIVILNGACP